MFYLCVVYCWSLSFENTLKWVYMQRHLYFVDKQRRWLQTKYVAARFIFFNKIFLFCVAMQRKLPLSFCVRKLHRLFWAVGLINSQGKNTNWIEGIFLSWYGLWISPASDQFKLCRRVAVCATDINNRLGFLKIP